jgi:hypothetical protein
MSDPKQLRFQFVVDEASLQKTRQLIRELTADLVKLNAEAGKAGGMGGGGGAGLNVSAGGRQSPEQQRVLTKMAPVGRQLVQGFLDQKQIFKGIADGSKDSLRVMTDSLKTAIAAQKRELQDLDATAAKLAQRYDSLGKTMKGMQGGWDQGMIPRFQGKQDQVAGEHFEVMSRRASAQQSMQALEEHGRQFGIRPPPLPTRVTDDMIVGEGGGGGSGGGGGGGPGLFGPRKLGPKMMAAMKIAGLVVAGGDAILDQSMASISGMSGMQSRRADVVTGQMQRLMGGDVKLLYAMQNMRGNDLQDLRDRTDSFSAKADVVRGSIGQTIAGAPVIGPVARMLGIGGGKGGNGGIGGAWTTGEQQSGLAENAIAQAEAYSKSLILENMGMDRFSGSLGARVGAGRTLGLGRNYDRRSGSWIDSYARQEDALRARGYSIEEAQGAKMQLQGMGGERFAFQHMDAAMRANAQGLGGYGNLLAAGQRAGIGEDFARGAIGGGIDANAGIQLGSSIIGSGFDPRGTTTGMGALMAAQGGFGWTGNASDFNLAQRAAMGLGMGDSLTTGGLDPYQRARNLVSSVNANPGMSIYGQDFLANGMSMKQMIDMGTGNSPMTATAEALGLSPDMIKKQLGSSVSSVTDRFKDTGGVDPMSQTLRAFRQFQGGGGGGISEFFDSIKDKDAKTAAVRNLGAFYGIQTGQGEEAGLGLMGLEAGLSNAEIGTLKKGQVGRGIGQTEKDALKGMAEASKQVTTALEGMDERLNNAFKAIPEKFATMKTFGESLDKSANDFVKSLTELTVAIKAETAKLGGFKTGARK